MARLHGTIAAPAPRLVALVAFTLAVALATLPAAAQDPLPLGKSTVPAEFRQFLELPIGISFVSMNPTETMDVTNLALAVGGQRLPPGAVSLPSVKHTTHVVAVRGDVWLLPFVNVYGTVGRVTGTASDIVASIAPGLLPPGVAVPNTLDYKGNVYGAGVTLAAGYRFAFASYDVNYSSNKVDLIDNRIGCVTQSVRAGVVTSAGKTRLAFYGGAFNESVGGTLTGTGLIPGINPNFSLNVTPHGPWNALVGGHVDITPHLVVLVEGGFGNRTHFLISPGVRF